MSLEKIFWPFMLTLFAGLSTSIGGYLAFFVRQRNVSAMAFMLGFSAGVMIYISFVEILQQSQVYLIHAIGPGGAWVMVGSFFIGIGATAMVDNLFPDHIDPELLAHNSHTPSPAVSDEALVYGQPVHEVNDTQELRRRLLNRTGLLTALAIGVHNLPEGLVTFMAGYSNISWGLSIAAAIAIHNIPEGIAVALPIYQATNNKLRAFTMATLSGLAEPIGALLGYFVLWPFMNDVTLGVIFALIAGIMIYISFDELIPIAANYAQSGFALSGLFLGMLVMAVSLLLL
ncbi:MAG: zinc transporter ZupT [Cyanobacteria bacterium HKST-UBA06]|nr:zinc transporter ZupT [Cyanobacteria bacterium HKST-UBA04]MCA9806776.1 zinc transporter ZupT [Cyanobacteria bacterium HKST-UBA06]MCA9841950.1 zinc transporter ZupT [Cyanobacteria bacterium HKST-UBA03]